MCLVLGSVVMGEEVGRRSLQGHRCLPGKKAVPLICATKAVPHGKEGTPQEKNQNTVKKAKCWVLREGKVSASETPKYAQRGEMNCPSSQDCKSFTSGLEDRTSEAGCTFY